MKKKIVLTLALLLMLLAFFAACAPTQNSGDTQGSSSAPSGSTSDGDAYDPQEDPLAQPYLELMQYYDDCATPGKVETLTYNVEMYAVEEKEGEAPGTRFEEKKLYVYLPYGYTAEKQYDILYLLHGSNETTDYWFYSQKAVSSFYRKVVGASNAIEINYTKNVLDNLIAEGKCDPFIVVTPSYNAATVDEKAYGSTLEETQFWLTTFEKELREDIIPLVESRYSTYAAGDTSEAGLKASRAHRAIAGFSKGGRYTSGYAMNNMLDVFSSFGCFHGCEDISKESIAKALADNPGCCFDFFYLGSGDADVSHAKALKAMHEMVLSDLSEVFTEGENYTFYNKPKGGHFYDSALLDLYHFVLTVYSAA